MVHKKNSKNKVCPRCGEKIWDTPNVDQAIGKCWECGYRYAGNGTDRL